MKKIIALGLIALAFGSFAFADDAKTMPMMVGRVIIAPTFAFVPGGYDTDGDYKSNDDGSAKLFNLGFALEYGIIDWITAGIQWAPGWTIWSDLEPATGIKDTNMNGVADLFVGAKVQIIGEKAPIKNDRFRFAISPGIIIPLPGPDFKEELTNVAKGEKATLASMDKHVFAFGGRLSFDWIINKYFFLNFFNETMFYPFKKDLIKHDPTLVGVQALGLTDVNGKVDYKYKTTFEIEPVFSTSLTDGLSLSAGLPVTYQYNPEYDFSLSGTMAFMVPPGTFSSEPSHILSVKPNVSLFVTSTPIPLEFKLQYAVPVWGKNASAQHAITLQVKVYFALPGRPE